MKPLNEFKDQLRGIFERSKTPDNIKNLEFIRWGNINPVKQKGYIANPGEDHSFHAPPAKKGIYAFPLGFVETFLLGAMEFIPDRYEWVKRPDGSKVEEDDPDAEEWEKRTKGKTGWKKLPAKGKVKGFVSPERKIQMAYDAGKMDKETYDKEMDKAESEREERYDKGYFLAKEKSPNRFKHNGEIWHHLFTKNLKSDEILKRHGAWILTSMQTYKKALAYVAGGDRRQEERDGVGPSRDHYEVFIERVKGPNKKKKPLPPMDDEDEYLEEKWERRLALGYSNEAEGADDAEDNLNNDAERVPGDTEFPTYDQLKAIKSKMSKHDLSFTVPYDEFSKRPSGEK